MKTKRKLFVSLLALLCLQLTTAQNNHLPSSGDVGIGTTNPQHKLHVHSPSIGDSFVYITGVTSGLIFSNEIESYPQNLFNPGIGISGRVGDFLNTSQIGDFVLRGGPSKDLLFGTMTGENNNNIFERMRITSTGNVGIGLTNPQAKLHVEGNAWGTGFKLNSNGLLKLRNFDGGDFGFRTALSAVYDTQTRKALLEINGRNNYKDGVVVKGDKMVINGKLAIGTTINNLHQLTLRGTMLAEGVKIRAFDNWVWPDYVFENDYHLIPLDELEVTIKEEGHLPNIPSAEEVQNNGFELGKMQAKLLEKIEELTLYTIQQQKEIEALKKQLQEVSNPNKQ